MRTLSPGHFLLIASLSLGLVACGGGEKPPAAGGSTQTESAATTEQPAQPTGTVHKVAMRGTATAFFFEPKEITVKRGDTVEWTMVDGGPHNVSFIAQADSIPAGAQAVLEQKGILTGPMLGSPNQTYTIQFTSDFPTGRYSYQCDPHAPLGMLGRVTITD